MGENKQTKFCVERHRDIKTFVNICQHSDLTCMKSCETSLVHHHRETIISTLLLFTVYDSDAQGLTLDTFSIVSVSHDYLLCCPRGRCLLIPRIVWLLTPKPSSRYLHSGSFYNNARHFLSKVGLQGRTQ